jgi:uncharacterized membrane protein
MSESNAFTNVLKKSLDSLKKKALPVIIGGALLAGSPLVSNALSSGSRSGGSSFRSGGSRSYSTRSYSSGTSYASPQVRNNIIITPSVGYGFGYSPFSYSPFGFNPFFGLMSPNVIIFSIAAYILFQVLSKNMAGGSDFSDNGDIGSLGNGATLMKIQVALDDDWSRRGNIMETLSSIASKQSDLSSRRALSQLLSDTSLALLRKSGDWNSLAYSGEYFNGRNSANCEPAFQKLAISERSKFEKEVSGGAYSGGSSKPTQVVVSLVVALRGKSQAYADNISSNRLLKECLQNLAADALTDDGENIMAVELLWTPSEPGATITPRDLIADYPELMKL